MSDKIRLADVMRSLAVTIIDDGFQLESVAGKAFYGATGLRGKVEGIPEYFPASLMVKDESKPAEPKPLPYGLAGNYLEDGDASFEPARIRGSVISTGRLCSNTIEQETLSAVLINTLPHAPRDHAEDIALQLSGAVKRAFSALEYKGNKEASILTVKLELDTREAQERLDELRAVISDIVDSAITKALMPGGKLRKAVSQKADVSELQALSSRVSQVGLALASHGSQITALQAKC